MYHFKVFRSVTFSTWPVLSDHHHHLQNIFITPRGDPVPTGSHFPFPPPLRPKQPLICVLSQWISLICTCHVNGITLVQDVVLYGLLSFKIMFLRSIRVVVCISMLLLFMAEFCPIVRVDHISFIHSSTDGHLGSFPPFG